MNYTFLLDAVAHACKPRLRQEDQFRGQPWQHSKTYLKIKRAEVVAQWQNTPVFSPHIGGEEKRETHTHTRTHAHIPFFLRPAV